MPRAPSACRALTGGKASPPYISPVSESFAMAKPGLIARRAQNRCLPGIRDTFGEMQLRKYTERAIRAARAEAELNQPLQVGLPVDHEP